MPFDCLKKSIAAWTVLSMGGLLFPDISVAHEYWIEPERYVVTKADPVIADLRNGQDFKGGSFAYITRNFQRFEVDAGGETRPIKGRQGDIPALSYKPQEEALHIFTFWSEPDTLFFTDWDKFTSYLEYEGLTAFVDEHLARGLPKTNFKESYTRNAKALVQVGEFKPEHQDRWTGMPFELVTGQNPYGLEGRSYITANLLWQGEPWPNWQVRVFEKPEKAPTGTEARTFTVMTDERGIAAIPIERGNAYLLSAVQLKPREGDLEKRETVWESWWAALTFAVPQGLSQ